MIHIFTTLDNLNSICNDADKKPWFDMIYKLKEVYVDREVDIPNDADPEDNIYLVLDGMQISVNDTERDFINDISTNPIRVLKYPSGIYLLDITEEAAEKIQNKFGVICQSINSLELYHLTMPHHPTELSNNMTGITWRSMIRQYVGMPSNSLLVIDAHLFDEDKFDEQNNQYDDRKCDGIENLFYLLDCLLPKTFNDTYHIGVLLTDTDVARSLGKSRTNLTNSRIASAINKLKRRLNRTYPLNIESVFFDSRDDGHKLIHNRRVISNYFIITADYKLAALRYGYGKSVAPQTITVYPLFENIERDPDTDKKQKRIINDINDLNEYFERQPRSHTAVLYQNGKKIDDFTQFMHRFFH